MSVATQEGEKKGCSPMLYFVCKSVLFDLIILIFLLFHHFLNFFFLCFGFSVHR